MQLEKDKFDLFGNKIEPKYKTALRKKYIEPPFSILDTKQGIWQNRKKLWIDLGIKSEIGRKENACFAQEALNRIMGDRKKLNINIDENDENKVGFDSGTSIFDPVLTELVYTWFCKKGGFIIDPFAGGSVRGIVADFLGYVYYGSDLSKEQIEANYIQAKNILSGHKITWLIGDSENEIDKFPEADLIFSCPPYHDLEVYSDDKNDLSNMNYNDFIIKYNNIIKKCCDKLKFNSFACFVITEIRDKKTGFYKGFLNDTIKCFNRAGLNYYNEFILLNAIGTAPIRAGKIFDSSRKNCRLHQNILIFIKGDPKKATQKIIKE